MFLAMTKEEEKESMLHRFLQFENAKVTERIGLLNGKPDVKPVYPQNTQIFDLKREISIIFF